MLIRVNNTYSIEVPETNLVVKDKRLYNTDTKEFEGIEGDLIRFTITKNGTRYICSGTVDGYTCGERVKLRGVKEEYTNAKDKEFERISSITDFIENTLIKVEEIII